MQNNPEAWKQKYDDLVQTKIDRLRLLSPDALAELRTKWAALVGEIRSVMTDDPASQKALELGKRWTGLLEKLMDKPLGSVELGRHQSSQEWNPQMATFVDKPVWDFMTRVLTGKL